MKSDGVLNGGRSVALGAVSGMAGGLAGSWLMNLFIEGVSKAKKKSQDSQVTIEASTSAEEQQSQQDSDDATQKVADAIVSRVRGSHLSKEEKKKGGSIVHYAFGGLMGALYGAIAEHSAAPRTGMGTFFGTALFVGADEIAIPVLGLGESPTQVPISDQATYLAAHLVYGATTELVRRGFRRLI